MRITGITFVGTRTNARPAMLRFVREVLGLAAAPEVDGMDADLFVMPDGSSFAVTPGVASTEDDRKPALLGRQLEVLGGGVLDRDRLGAHVERRG